MHGPAAGEALKQEHGAGQPGRTGALRHAEMDRYRIISMSELGNNIASFAGGRRKRFRSRPDWKAVEHDYRSGVWSLRQLGAMHGCSHSSIANRAQREGWTRTSAESFEVGDAVSIRVR